MDLVLYVVVGILALVGMYKAGVRLAVWHYEIRPKTLSGAELQGKFDGLVRFGTEGSYLALREKETGASIRFTKRGGAGNARIEVEVDPDSAPLKRDRLDTGLAPLGLERTELSGQTIVVTDAVDLIPTKLEAIARLLGSSLGHTEATKYRIEFEGPSDNEAIKEFFGWR